MDYFTYSQSDAESLKEAHPPHSRRSVPLIKTGFLTAPMQLIKYKPNTCRLLCITKQPVRLKSSASAEIKPLAIKTACRAVHPPSEHEGMMKRR